jgi:RIO kinase 1
LGEILEVIDAAKEEERDRLDRQQANDEED